MKWMIELVYVFGSLLLTSLTGTIIVAFWLLTGCFFDKRGYFSLFYRLLRLIPVFFLVPFAALLLKLPYFQNMPVICYLFEPTPIIYNFAKKALFVWLAGAICIMGRYLASVWLQCCRNMNRIPCSPKIQQIYQRICKEAGVEHFPQLYQSYGIKVPVAFGVLRTKIFLPVAEWTTEQLQVILLHELNHYRRRDNWLKWVSVLVLSVHWTNPAVWVFHKLVIRWIEYSCDWLCYEKCGGRKQYFQVIIAISEERGRMQGRGLSALFKDTNEIERRVKRMKRCGKKREGAKWVSVLLTMFIMTASAGSVCAATGIAADKYYGLYRATDESVEDLSTTELIEYQDYEPLPGTKEEAGETEMYARGVSTFNWTINANVTKKTGLQYIASGKIMVVSYSVEPDTKRVKVGIKNSNGKRSYVYDSGVGSHSFSISESGYYMVFIENINSTPVKVSGSCVW